MHDLFGNMQTTFDWADHVVIGSGIGAAAFAHALIEAKKNVLVLEAGEWPHRDAEDWNAKSILIDGRYTKHPLHPAVEVTQYGRSRRDPVLTRPVVGGMSVFYGGAAFRLRENDFRRWPVTLSYRVFAPYYDRAEALLNVHGDDGLDPTRPRRSQALRAPIAVSKPAQRIQAAARALKLRPFPIPLAIRFDSSPRCVQCNTCDGFPCQIEAKVDGATLLKALAGPHLRIITSCFVEKINFSAGRAVSVECRFGAQAPRQTFAVKNLSLGAGSIGSAALMLKSSRSGETLPSKEHFGRYLMRHANGIVGALFLKRTNPENSFSKQTAIMDFYEDFRSRSGFATGVIQDIYTPAAQVVKHFAPRGVHLVAGVVSEFIQNLLCVAEDEPRAENRVEVQENGAIRLTHAYTAADLQRRDHLIGKAKLIFKKSGR